MMLRELLEKIIHEKWITAEGVLESSWLKASEMILKSQIPASGKVIAISHHLRQQREKSAGIPYLCLADYIAPKSQGKQDYIGALL